MVIKMYPMYLNHQSQTTLAAHIVRPTLSNSNDIEFDWKLDKTMLIFAVYKAAEIVANPMGCSTLVSESTQEIRDWKESVIIKLSSSGFHTASNLIIDIQGSIAYWPKWKKSTMKQARMDIYHLRSKLNLRLKTFRFVGLYNTNVQLLLSHCSHMICSENDSVGHTLQGKDVMNTHIGAD